MEKEFIMLGFMSIMGFIPLLPVVMMGILSTKRLFLFAGLFILFGLFWIGVCWIFSDLSFIQIILLEDIRPGAIKKGISVSYVMIITAIELLLFAIFRTIIKRDKKPNKRLQDDAATPRA